MRDVTRRRLLQAGAALSLPLSLSGVRAQPSSQDPDRIVFGATVHPPYWDIVELIKPKAREYGLDLGVKPFADTRQINATPWIEDFDRQLYFLLHACWRCWRCWR